ncbi:MAG TPA: polyphenol oxidase family protein [Rectinemataceae bacterium]|nr:polyphenol oxidase family protein [Rectinemataceae bacterium]
MQLVRAPLPVGAERALCFAFPGPNEGAKGPSTGEPRALLSLRSQGDMRIRPGAVNPDRQRFFSDGGVDPDRVLGVKLAHSRSILFSADRDEHGRLAEEALRSHGGADGILTADPQLIPTITAADCMPIWLLDRHSGWFGVLHSGWRGTGILAAALGELRRRFGSPPSALAVILGPAIGSCCYDVPEERATLFLERYGPRAAFRRDGAWRLDLREANLVIAEREGVGHLRSIDACTSCDPRLGSYRREGPQAFTCMAASCGHFPEAAGVPA